MTKENEIKYLTAKDSYLRDGFEQDFRCDENDIERMLDNIRNDLPIFHGTMVAEVVDGFHDLKWKRQELENTVKLLREQLEDALQVNGTKQAKLEEEARERMFEGDTKRAQELVGGTQIEWVQWKLRNGYTLEPDEYEFVAGKLSE